MQINLSPSSLSALSRLLGEQSGIQDPQRNGAAQAAIQQALTAMNEAVASDGLEDKERAKLTLEDARATLIHLKVSDLPTIETAREAAALGQTIRAAADTFADAVVSTRANPLPSSEATPSSAANSSPYGSYGGYDDDAAPVDVITRAYHAMEEETRNVIAAGDLDAIAQFKTVALEVRSLIEDSLRRLVNEKNTDRATFAQAQGTLGDLNGTIANLSSVAAAEVGAPILSFTL